MAKDVEWVQAKDGLFPVPSRQERNVNQLPLGIVFNLLVIHLVKSDTLFIDIIIVFENAFTCQSIKHIF